MNPEAESDPHQRLGREDQVRYRYLLLWLRGTSDLDVVVVDLLVLQDDGE